MPSLRPGSCVRKPGSFDLRLLFCMQGRNGVTYQFSRQAELIRNGRLPGIKRMTRGQKGDIMIGGRARLAADRE